MVDLLAILLTATIAVPLVVPLVLALLPRVDHVVMKALFLGGFWTLRLGLTRVTTVVGWVLRNLCAAAPALALGFCLRALADSHTGRTQRAVKGADTMLRAIQAACPDWCSWTLLNLATDIFVNAGLYRRAVDLAADWSTEARDSGREYDPANYAIAQINRAEALHNLGRNAEALASLDALEDLCHLDPLIPQGRAVLRAWILAHMNRADEAEALLESVDPIPFGRSYQSELLYTQSLVARERGELGVAIQTGRLGLKIARRASSQRNGMVIVAAAELARGNHQDALKLLTAAARHRYQGQSAPGLFLLGQLHERAGREDEARQVYARALELDPESFLCGAIRDRLAT